MIGERRKGTLKEASIESFVTAQVTSRGLDGRTAKAYHLDLEHLYQWTSKHGVEHIDEKAVESYLEYLAKERKLKHFQGLNGEEQQDGEEHTPVNLFLLSCSS